MKIIYNTIIPLFLAVILSSCNGDVALTPTMSQINVMGTARAIVKTEVVMTLTAVSTATFPPPTPIPPMPTEIPPDSYADKIDYAMVIARKNSELLPYYNGVYVTGALSGCVATNDFSSFVTYLVAYPDAPFEAVKTDFENYLQTEKWEFTEANHEVVGNPELPRTTYDVYRISSKDISAFERLEISLDNWSFNMEKNYIYVRAKLTHIETKENFSYLTNFYCSNGNWAELYKPWQ